MPGIPVEEIAGDVSDTIASEVDGAVPDVDTIVLAEVERWRLAELRAIDPDLVLEFQAVLDDRTSPLCRACAGTACARLTRGGTLIPAAPPSLPKHRAALDAGPHRSTLIP